MAPSQVKPKKRRNRGKRQFTETFNADTFEHAAIRAAAKRDGRTLAGFLRYAAIRTAHELGIEVAKDA
jgi:hypothetical protein